MEDLNGKTVFVTGASGFIGARAVEHLLRTGARVRALVRRPVLAHRLPDDRRLTFVVGDVTDRRSLDDALGTSDVVVNCVWGGDDLVAGRCINVQGTVNLVQAAAARGARRIVHISTMAVHGKKTPAVLTEECPLVRSGDAYSVTKAEGEQAAFLAGKETGVEVIALRPTVVYGPNSPLWVLAYFERVLKGHVKLIGGGAGLANLVYVDDVVQAILLSCVEPLAAGEAFLISASEPVTWRDYLGAFAAMVDAPLPPSTSHFAAKLEAVVGKLAELGLGAPRRVQGPDLALMPQRVSVSIEKARRVLGYEPRYSLSAGMARCRDWLLAEGYLPAKRLQDGSSSDGASELRLGGRSSRTARV